MNENLIIPNSINEKLIEIENNPLYWAEYSLSDLPDYPIHCRKIVVSGFNIPDLENENDKKIYITIKQILTNKETGVDFKKNNAPIYTIFSSDSSDLMDEENKIILVDKHILDIEGNFLEIEKSTIKTPAIEYFKYNIINRKIHIIDIFRKYLEYFAVNKKEELDKI